MSALLRLIWTYFTCTTAQRAFSAAGVLLFLASLPLLRMVPHPLWISPVVVTAAACLFIGSSMMPLIMGRMAVSRTLSVLPAARLKLLTGALVTLLIVTVPFCGLFVYSILTVLPPSATPTPSQLAMIDKGLRETFLLTLTSLIIFCGWLYVALWFITSQRNTMGLLKGLGVIAVVIVAPTRQILAPDLQVRWHVETCAATVLTFSVLFLSWPKLQPLAAAARRAAGKALARLHLSHVTGREIDLMLGTANPWLPALAQLVPVMLAARIGYYSAAVWLFYLTIFSTVAGAIAGQAAERSRRLWLRGDWSREQLFRRVELSFWRYSAYSLGVLFILMVAIGRFMQLPLALLVMGLPLLFLGTILSTYLGLMVTRRLGWSESALGVAVMLTLMAVAVLAARAASFVTVVGMLEVGLAALALGLRAVARRRWAQIDWMQCRADRALGGRSAA